MAIDVKAAAGTTDRRAAVESVLASFRMEGLEPDAETATLLEQFASGSLSLEEFGLAIERHTARLSAARAMQKAS